MTRLKKQMEIRTFLLCFSDVDVITYMEYVTSEVADNDMGASMA